MSDRRIRGLEASTSDITTYNAEHKKYIYDTDKGYNVYRIGAVTPSYPTGGELLHFVMTKNDVSQIDPALRYATISPVGNITISGDITVSATKSIGISTGAARISYPSSGTVSVMDANFGIGTESPSVQLVLYKASGSNALEIQSTATTTRLSKNYLGLDTNGTEGGSSISINSNVAELFCDGNSFSIGTNIDKPMYLQQNGTTRLSLNGATSAFTGNVQIAENSNTILSLKEIGTGNVASFSFDGTDIVQTNTAGLLRIGGAGGTSSNAGVKLLINGAVQVTASSTPALYMRGQTDSNYCSFIYDGTDQSVKYSNGTNELLRVKSSGILEIGTGTLYDNGALLNIRGGNAQISDSNIGVHNGPTLYMQETHDGSKVIINYDGGSLKTFCNTTLLSAWDSSGNIAQAGGITFNSSNSSFSSYHNLIGGGASGNVAFRKYNGGTFTIGFNDGSVAVGSRTPFLNYGHATIEGSLTVGDSTTGTGIVYIKGLGSAPAAPADYPNEGGIYYNKSDERYYIYQDSVWKEIAVA